MNHKKIQKAIRDAEKYPLTVRIAARLHLNGVKGIDFRNECLLQPTDPIYRSLSFTVINEIYCKLRNIETDDLKLTPLLKRLAEQVDL